MIALHFLLLQFLAQSLKKLVLSFLPHCRLHILCLRVLLFLIEFILQILYFCFEKFLFRTNLIQIDTQLLNFFVLLSYLLNQISLIFILLSQFLLLLSHFLQFFLQFLNLRGLFLQSSLSVIIFFLERVQIFQFFIFLFQFAEQLALQLLRLCIHHLNLFYFLSQVMIVIFKRGLLADQISLLFLFYLQHVHQFKNFLLGFIIVPLQRLIVLFDFFEPLGSFSFDWNVCFQILYLLFQNLLLLFVETFIVILTAIDFLEKFASFEQKVLLYFSSGFSHLVLVIELRCLHLFSQLSDFLLLTL